MTAQPLDRPKSLTAMAFDRLLHSIVHGEIAYGTMLSEKAVAETFGTSKTPIREAFFQLQSLGLVEIQPQRGCFVPYPTLDKVRELCELRIELESYALTLSMERGQARLLEALSATFAEMEEMRDGYRHETYHKLDQDFHKAFFVASGNTLLAEVYGTIDPRIQALRANFSSPNEQLFDVSRNEHAAIVQAVADRNIESATATIRSHISRVRDIYSDGIEKRKPLDPALSHL
ncbi:GntR family transcriptional regulator [Kaistia defluvii]|uniref:GntR family transcriptional regulator n=1 Tax=Kaistia defluvii TaxID=410841 RepID=UPI002259DE40|nr:GntR family transcriptional regulator [Kaistia defluvii]MCX5517256.1 GntR family transcriptional regulator [Kaistia defluvii]